MKIQVLKRFVILVLFVVIFLFIFFLTRNNKQLLGDQVVSRIKNYQEIYKRLPSSLSELGIKETEEGPIYYNKESDGKFILWYGDVLGGSVIYDSDNQKWQKFS